MKEKRVFFGLFVNNNVIFYDISCNNGYEDIIQFRSAPLATAYNGAVGEMFDICYAHDYGLSSSVWVLR
jgi:hypothetical protein